MEVSRAQGLNDVLGAITAGSDTTSTVLSGLFYHLFSNRVTFDRLRVEVDSEFPPGEGEPFDGTRLAELKYLNAIMYVFLIGSYLLFDNILCMFPVVMRRCVYSPPFQQVFNGHRRRELEVNGLEISMFFL